MSRQPIIAGNWKMFKTGSEAKNFITELMPLVSHALARVFVAAPFTALQSAAQAAKGSQIVIGAQNMHDAVEGAFTGEISASMIKEAGANFVLLGHSERRQFFHEKNDFINRKVTRALSENLTPLLCVGETQEERDAEKTSKVLKTQLEECLSGVSNEQIEKIIIAYEPVWAIGTGKTATPEIAQEAHSICRDFLSKKWGRPVSDKVALLYGGSVKLDNIEGLMKMPDIDGALIGGASLQAKTFAQIINLVR